MILRVALPFALVALPACSNGNTVSAVATSDAQAHTEAGSVGDGGPFACSRVTAGLGVPGDAGEPVVGRALFIWYSGFEIQATFHPRSDTAAWSSDLPFGHPIVNLGCGCQTGWTPVGGCCYFAGAQMTPQTRSLDVGTFDVVDVTSALWLGYLTPPLYSVNSPGNSQFGWAGGDTLKLTTADGGAPDGSFAGALSMSGIVPPKPETSFQFSLLNIKRSEDFTIAWTPGGGDAVWLELSDGSSNPPQTFSCNAPDADGRITVASALIGRFAANDNGYAVLGRLSVSDTSTQGSAVRVTIGNAQRTTASFY